MISYNDIKLVLGNIDDYDFYYNLKSEPSNIYWSGHKTRPDYHRFKQWYIDKVINKQIEFRFIEYKNEKVGALYFTIQGKTCKYLGLAVSEKFSGMGVATASVKSYIEYLKINFKTCEKVQFVIREDNRASIKIHEQLGCKRTGNKESVFLESDDKTVLMEEWELIIQERLE